MGYEGYVFLCICGYSDRHNSYPSMRYLEDFKKKVVNISLGYLRSQGGDMYILCKKRCFNRENYESRGGQKLGKHR